MSESDEPIPTDEAPLEPVVEVEAPAKPKKAAPVAESAEPERTAAMLTMGQGEK